MLLFSLAILCHLASTSKKLTICGEIEDNSNTNRDWWQSALKEAGFSGVPTLFHGGAQSLMVFLAPGGEGCVDIDVTEFEDQAMQLESCVAGINFKITSMSVDTNGNKKTWNSFTPVRQYCEIDNGNAVELTAYDEANKHGVGESCGSVCISLPSSSNTAEVYNNHVMNVMDCNSYYQNSIGYGYDYYMFYGSILLLICVLSLFNCWCINKIIKYNNSKVNKIQYSKVQHEEACDKI
eukprot:4979_1